MIVPYVVLDIALPDGHLPMVATIQASSVALPAADR